MTEDTDDLQELVDDFVTESREHLGTIENDLLSLEEDTNADTVDNVFRSVHSVKGVAGFLGFDTIQALAHALESTLDLVRKQRLKPTADLIDVLLEAADGLKGLIEDIDNSNKVDIDHHTSALAKFMPPPEAAKAPEVVASVSATADHQEQANERNKPTQDKPATEPTKQTSGSRRAASKGTDSIRVHVDLLNRMMNISGEMVLGRNQLLQSTRSSQDRHLLTAVSNLSHVVSEMQEAIMQTRLQPVATILQKMPRIVRDLTTKLGKKCQLVMEGKEVEMDRSILEALGDPLTHLVRNALDHGIETPETRRAKDKPVEGVLLLQAYNQGGSVIIRIQDDGAGIDPEHLRNRAVDKELITAEQASTMSDRDARMLIFAPGFSTAQAVSDVSGRGVGMDVVRSNIERLGGCVEVVSEVNRGTTLTITIPLTLAIIPALVVQCAERRYALPQNNIVELVHIRPNDRQQRLASIKGRKVLRLRGELLPILGLYEALGVPRSEDVGESSSLNIMIVKSGTLHYGLMIDSPPDTEEIVVKPLGQHVRNHAAYSGSTILGDGRVAMILDPAGLAAGSNLVPVEEERTETASTSTKVFENQLNDFVVFRNSPDELFAVPLGMVQRIQRVPADQLLHIGDDFVYRNDEHLLPVVQLDHYVRAEPLPPSERDVSLLVLRAKQTEFALQTSMIENVHLSAVAVDLDSITGDAIMGSFLLNGHTVRLVDVTALALAAVPRLLKRRNTSTSSDRAAQKSVLLVDESSFFRRHIQQIMENADFAVTLAANSEEAWQHIQSADEPYALIVADIEGNETHGLELTRRIREQDELAQTPVIALTSIGDQNVIESGRAAGVSSHTIKQNEGALIAAMREATEVEA